MAVSRHESTKWNPAVPLSTGERRHHKTIDVMIRLYCRDRHGSGGELCPDCQSLRRYAEQRLARCPYRPNKPACSKCPTHCYQQVMRERVRQVMSYAGRRMLLRHPVLSFWHLVDCLRKHRKKPRVTTS